MRSCSSARSRAPTSPRICAPTGPWACPYSDEMVESARLDLRGQADPEGDHEAVLARYPKAVVGDFDGNPRRLTEMDALVAYLQILGRMVDFGELAPGDLRQ